MAKTASAFVYLLRCSDGTLYTGWTRNVTRRLKEHQRGVGARYTRSRRPLALVYFETCESASAAMRREVAIKRMARPSKLRLIAAQSCTQ